VSVPTLNDRNCSIFSPASSIVLVVVLCLPRAGRDHQQLAKDTKRDDGDGAGDERSTSENSVGHGRLLVQAASIRVAATKCPEIVRQIGEKAPAPCVRVRQELPRATRDDRQFGKDARQSRERQASTCKLAPPPGPTRRHPAVVKHEIFCTSREPSPVPLRLDV